jgi:thiol-disulfide isomerase/thioredoxin
MNVMPIRVSALLLTLSGIATTADQPGLRAALQPADERRAAPQFALKDSSGKTVSLKDHRRKVVPRDFWATWCTGCKKEIPWFAEFQKGYGTRGLVVVGVSMDEGGWKSWSHSSPKSACRTQCCSAMVRSRSSTESGISPTPF